MFHQIIQYRAWIIFNKSIWFTVIYCIIYSILWVWVFYLNTSICITCVPSDYGDQKRVLDPLILKLQRVVSHQVGVENWILGPLQKQQVLLNYSLDVVIRSRIFGSRDLEIFQIAKCFDNITSVWLRTECKMVVMKGIKTGCG